MENSVIEWATKGKRSHAANGEFCFARFAEGEQNERQSPAEAL